MQMGVIYIHDGPEGKSYVGKTWRIDERYVNGKLSSHYQQGAFHRAVQYFGTDAFTTSEICRIESESSVDDDGILIMLEIMAIEFFGTLKPFGYNSYRGGSGGTFTGRKHSEETKRRMSEARKRENLPLRRRIKMAKAQVGRPRDAHGRYS